LLLWKRVSLDATTTTKKVRIDDVFAVDLFEAVAAAVVVAAVLRPVPLPFEYPWSRHLLVDDTIVASLAEELHKD
jgi:hypothetical protein